MEVVRTPLRAVGRAALAAMFITGGADALWNPGPRAPRASELGVPLEPAGEGICAGVVDVTSASLR
jgi:hypothetical protein